MMKVDRNLPPPGPGMPLPGRQPQPIPGPVPEGQLGDRVIPPGGHGRFPQPPISITPTGQAVDQVILPGEHGRYPSPIPGPVPTGSGIDIALPPGGSRGESMAFGGGSPQTAGAPRTGTQQQTQSAPGPMANQTTPAAPAAPAPPPAPRYTNPDGSPGAEIPKPDPTWVANKQGNAWVPPNHPDAAGGAPGGASGAPGAPAGPPANIKDAFQQALMQRLQSNPGDVSADSAEIAPAINARRLENQRAEERQRAQLAGMMGGANSGGMESAISGLRQQRAAGDANFVGDQVSGLANRRAQELTQALVLAGDTLSNEQRLALTGELEKLRIAQQGALGGRDLDIRDKLGSGGLNLGLLGLLQGGDQFGKNLGAQLGMFGANLNQQALLQMLGGL